MDSSSQLSPIEPLLQCLIRSCDTPTSIRHIDVVEGLYHIDVRTFRVRFFSQSRFMSLRMNCWILILFVHSFRTFPVLRSPHFVHSFRIFAVLRSPHLFHTRNDAILHLWKCRLLLWCEVGKGLKQNERDRAPCPYTAPPPSLRCWFAEEQLLATQEPKSEIMHKIHPRKSYRTVRVLYEYRYMRALQIENGYKHIR